MAKPKTARAKARPTQPRTAGGRFAPRPAQPQKPQEFFRGARLMRGDDEAHAEFSEITDTSQRLYLQALARSMSWTRAAKAAGVCAKTAYNWRQKLDDVAFQEAFEVATRLGIERAAGEFYRRGIDGVEKPVYQQGRLVGTVQEYDTPAGIFWLKQADRARFGENVDHRHLGPSGGPIQVEALLALPDAGLFEKLDQIRAALTAGQPSQPATIDVTPEPVQTPAAAAYAAELARRHGGNGSGNNGGG